MPDEDDTDTGNGDNHEPPNNITFNDIVKAAEASTPWRRIYADSSRPRFVGRLEDRSGWSFPTEVSYEAINGSILFQAWLAKRVRCRAGEVRKLVDEADASSPGCTGINWAPELGTLRIRAQGDRLRQRRQLHSFLRSLSRGLMVLVNDENLRLAIEIGGGELMAVPIDLFDPKYDEDEAADFDQA